MKRIIIFFFAVLSIFSVYSQTQTDYDKLMKEGNTFFENGNYGEAAKKYDQAYNTARGQDQEINADSGSSTATKCAEYIKNANQAFNNKNYKVAKEYYQIVLNYNKKDTFAIGQLEKCEDFLKITLTLSIDNITFSSSGGEEKITVTTNAGSYSVNSLPSWCTVKRNTDNFTIAVSENSGTETREVSITVKAGDKTESVRVRQEGKAATPPPATLRVSNENLSFPASGGKSDQITVYSNAGTYSVSSVPSWCSVQTYNGYFVVNCSANYTESLRSSWLLVKAGTMEVKVYVTQSGANVTATQSSRDYSVKNKIYTEKSFNSPKMEDTWGLTLGYTQRVMNFYVYDDDYYYNDYQYLDGVQLGVTFSYLFKYGFGFNMGLLLEACTQNISGSDWSDNQQLEYYAMNLPINLEYRLNFSKWFTLFAYGGIGLSVVTDSSFEDYISPTTFEYGGGLRINHIQFNVGKSLHLGDLKKTDYSGIDIKTYHDLVVSVSYMF